MNIEYQKTVAKDILAKLQLVDMWAMLAGGACRDWYLGNEASDLDFYVHYSTKYPQWALVEHFSKLVGCELKIVGRSGDKVCPESEVIYTQDPNIDFVLGGNKDGIDIQIIIINKPYFNVGNFCFDICQAFTYNVDEIKTTAKFNKAVEHKCIQITGEFYSQKDAYIKKIKSKFPDWLHIGF